MIAVAGAEFPAKLEEKHCIAERGDGPTTLIDGSIDRVPLDIASTHVARIPTTPVPGAGRAQRLAPPGGTGAVLATHTDLTAADPGA